ncbi:DUF2997 domain-containing protein [Arthrobacter sp. 131MFCol6.1]|uniref:DUF2997 domain-containing protein n=1 Tax=Arthrobacter sp. 131MFCol6.1 TaxID=1157944 RepID=UPI0009DA523F|nr:DUF2997 domain-containing protein [Arthrobacter sp. 131MFCol6.1]
MKKITITVSYSGAITAESSGQPGPSCMDELAMIQALLPGAEIADSRLTPEYFQVAHTPQAVFQQTMTNESEQ